MAEAAVERFGGIDYLVNNAAIFGTMQLDLLLTVDWEYLNRFLPSTCSAPSIACGRVGRP